MKYIFRYTILSNFPNQANKITEQELSQALQSVKFQFNKYNLNHLEELCLTCVQKFFTRPQDKVVTLIEDVLKADTTKVPEFNAKQLQNIWQQEKVNVYKCILQNSCQSSYTFKDMQWSVKNIIMRRVQSVSKGNNILTGLRINCLSNEEGLGDRVSMDISVSKVGFERMYESLQECENVVNEILLCEE